MPSLGGIPVGVQNMNRKGIAMTEETKIPRKKAMRPTVTSDLVYEIKEALDYQKRAIEWLLENLSEDGKPLSRNNKEIIKGALLRVFRDQADEAVVTFCFGDEKYGLDSILNLVTRMERFMEVVA